MHIVKSHQFSTLSALQHLQDTEPQQGMSCRELARLGTRRSRTRFCPHQASPTSGQPCQPYVNVLILSMWDKKDALEVRPLFQKGFENNQHEIRLDRTLVNLDA